MKKEFKLNEKITEYESKQLPYIYVEDIKEFIQREEYLLQQLYQKKISFEEFFEEREKLTGDLK